MHAHKFQHTESNRGRKRDCGNASTFSPSVSWFFWVTYTNMCTQTHTEHIFAEKIFWLFLPEWRTYQLTQTHTVNVNNGGRKNQAMFRKCSRVLLHSLNKKLPPPSREKCGSERVKSIGEWGYNKEKIDKGAGNLQQVVAPTEYLQ